VVAQLVTWAFNDPHVGNPALEVNRFFASIGESLFAGALLFAMHLAVEPAVRKYWPDSLLGWTRLLQGRLVDPQVGRDVLIGLAAGALMQALMTARDPLQWWLGAQYPAASFGNTRYFEGTHYVLGYFSSVVGSQAVFTAMWCIFTIVGLKRLLNREWIAAVLATVVFALIAGRTIFAGAAGAWWLNVLMAGAVFGVFSAVAIRIGLLAAIACLVASYMLAATPWTFDPGAWFFPQSATALTLVCGLAVFGGIAAAGGMAAFSPGPALPAGIRRTSGPDRAASAARRR
jgi:hypothetical protein